MSLSPEVQSAVDEIRRNKSLVKSLQAERDLWKQKAQDAQGKLDEISKVASMSEEDKAAIKAASAELDALNDELDGAAQANVTDSGQSTAPAAPAAPVDPYAGMTPEQIAEARGQDKAAAPVAQGVAPAVEGAPLMPNSAFDPTGGSAPGPADAGQPQQPAPIETAGGFVVMGGGTTQRAPGSRPESPSSSLVVPPEAIEAAAAPADSAQPVGEQPVDTPAPNPAPDESSDKQPAA